MEGRRLRKWDLIGFFNNFAWKLDILAAGLIYLSTLMFNYTITWLDYSIVWLHYSVGRWVCGERVFLNLCYGILKLKDGRLGDHETIFWWKSSEIFHELFALNFIIEYSELWYHSFIDLALGLIFVVQPLCLIFESLAKIDELLLNDDRLK